MYDVSYAGTIKGDEMNGDLLMAGAPVATVKCKKAAEGGAAPKTETAPKPAEKTSK
jgi:hypothetical protein